MAFKTNLLTKMAIDRLVGRIAGMIGSVESGKRIDKALLAELMTHFPWHHRRERDLDLYLERDTAEKTRILVLDNDLAIYHTTVDDVVLRKSPTVKEMVSIKNAIKILNDQNVVESKKEASLKTIRDVAVDRLDLAYTATDIEGLAGEGREALAVGDIDGVKESLLLFAELLGLSPAPRAFALERHAIYGKRGHGAGGESTFGPLVIYSPAHNRLCCLERVLSSRDKGRFDHLKAAVAGECETAAEGSAVFDLMAAKVLAGGGRGTAA